MVANTVGAKLSNKNCWNREQTAFFSSTEIIKCVHILTPNIFSLSLTASFKKKIEKYFKANYKNDIKF